MTNRLSVADGWDWQRRVRARSERLTLATATTATRTSITVILCAISGVYGRTRPGFWILLVAILIFWIGDGLDGAIARWGDHETIFGAFADVVGDRLSVIAICLTAMAAGQNGLLLAVFALHYVSLDLASTTLFVRFRLVSPNYFYLVHTRLFQINWTRPAKVASQIPLVAALVGLSSTIVTWMMIAVSIWK